jgi:ketosteroid isomerase-like protein
VSANFDIVRSIYADWERGAYSDADWAHPDIEYVQADGPDAVRTTGLAAMAETHRNWLSAWEGFWAKAEAYRQLDDERVLVLWQVSGRGKSSGVDLGGIRAEGAQIFHVRESKVVRIILYLDRARAHADLGSTREADSA